MTAPLLTAEEAGQVLFPDLPPKVGRRRMYGLIRMRVLPAEIVFQAGRRIYLKSGPLAAWLGMNGQPADVEQ